MPDPLAYFLTWTTYGSWLPGDARGWINSRHGGVQAPDQERETFTRQSLRQAAVALDAGQRDLVDETIRRHCEIRQWTLLAINVRTNHVHVVVSADATPEVVMSQFKSWASRRLNERCGELTDQGASRRKWWTEHGSTRWINDEKSLAMAIRYVLEEQ